MYGLLTLFSLLAIGLILFFLRFDSQSVRHNLQKSLDDTQRTVTINGSISPMLFPSPGLSLGKLQISEPGQPATFASIGEVEARLAWLPLLFGELEITHLALHDTQLNVVRATDGSLNFADLLQRRKTSRLQIITPQNQCL